MVIANDSKYMLESENPSQVELTLLGRNDNNYYEESKQLDAGESQIRPTGFVPIRKRSADYQ